MAVIYVIAVLGPNTRPAANGLGTGTLGVARWRVALRDAVPAHHWRAVPGLVHRHRGWRHRRGLALLIALCSGAWAGAVLRGDAETAMTSVMLYVVLFGAMLFAKLISFSGLADELLMLVNGSGLSRMGILLAILAVFLLLGCVMDAMAIILIFVPLFAPTLVAQGFDLVWFGIIVVVLTEIGLITPPVGMNVFVLKANLPAVPVGTIFRGLLPFVVSTCCDWPCWWCSRPSVCGWCTDAVRRKRLESNIDRERPATQVAGAEGATAPETLRQKDRSMFRL
jgi:hypothetical protein